MTKVVAIVLVTILVVVGSLTVTAQETAYQFEFLPGTEALSRAVYLTHAGDERLFIVEQVGRIWIYEEGELLATPFLDMVELVDSAGNEEGLLSVAFDPHYAENGRFFVNFTTYDSATSISRYQVSADDPNLADPDSREEILSIDQPYGNHNGGLVKFGPDGYLYIGMGDGGSGGDPQNHGQNQQTLLGDMLRIDVSGETYSIPPDNPFVDSATALPEIWASGLRNPWRFSFDRATGDLYIGDVGQGRIEEINFQPAASTGGENYGWRFFEGTSKYEDAPENEAPFVFPIAEYSHNEGCSVTGGYVYRGSALPALVGTYLYGDYCSGTIWSLQREGDAWTHDLFMQTDFQISSFGEDLHGELYLMSFSSKRGVHKLVADG